MISFAEAEKYFDKAKRDYAEESYDDALFHARKCLEALVKPICREARLSHSGITMGSELSILIDNMYRGGLIPLSLKDELHRLRISSNSGAHVDDLGAPVDTVLVAESVLKRLEAVLSAMTSTDWDALIQKMNASSSAGASRQNLDIPPFISQI